MGFCFRFSMIRTCLAMAAVTVLVSLMGCHVKEDAPAPSTQAPAITSQPAAQSVTAGQTATFTVAASGNPAPTYQWDRSADGLAWTAVSGATGTTFTFVTQAGDQGAQVRARASNSAGTATSAPATLTVQSQPTVQIATPSTAVTEGASVIFSAVAGGFPQPALQWEASADGGAWTSQSGATAATWTLAAKLIHNTWKFRARATSSLGTATSNELQLTVAPLAQVAVAVTPATASLATGATQTFAATVTGNANTAVTWSVVETGGGTVTAAGAYTAPQTAGTYHVKATSVADPTKAAQATVTVAGASVTILPASVSLAAAGTQTFAATVTGSANTAVTWSVVETGGGTVTAAGVYTAPPTAGTYHVKATSVADPTKAAQATVTVAGVNVTILPANVSLAAGGTQTFAATVTGSASTAVTWSVVEAGGGTVTAAGVYTAPQAAGTYHVMAISVADTTKAAQATVTVAAVGVAMLPATVSLAPSGTQTFAATVTGSANTAVTWSVVETGGGTVTTAGVYTAPHTAGTYHVKATSAADATKTAQATVTVAAVGITINLPGATLGLGASQTFAATVTGSSNTAVTWSVVETGGGTVTAAGVYTAPQTAGIYHVRATSVADPSRYSESTVTVVLGIVLSPAAVALEAGAGQTFTATVTGSANTAVTWSVLEAAGGAVTAAGAYTAPLAAGLWHVRATSVADPSRYAEAAVTVAATAVTLSPASATLGAGSTQALTATVTGAFNKAVVWSVQEPLGGTIADNGLFQAAQTAGQVHVRATSAANPLVYAEAVLTVTPVSITLAPSRVVVTAGGTAALQAALVGLPQSDLAWTVLETGGGTITAGTYQAPATAGTYTVKASSLSHPGVQALASITVTSAVTFTVDASVTPSGNLGGYLVSSNLGSVAAAAITALPCGERDLVSLDLNGQPWLLAIKLPSEATGVLDVESTAVAMILNHPMLAHADGAMMKTLIGQVKAHAGFPAIKAGVADNLASGFGAPLSTMATARLAPLMDALYKDIVPASMFTAPLALAAPPTAAASTGFAIPGSQGRMTLAADGDRLTFTSRYSTSYVAYGADNRRFALIDPRDGWLAWTRDWLHLTFSAQEGEAVTNLSLSALGVPQDGYRILNLVRCEPGSWDWNTAGGYANWMNVLTLGKIVGGDILPNLVVSGDELGKVAKVAKAIQTVGSKIETFKNDAKFVVYQLEAGVTLLTAIHDVFPEFVTNPTAVKMLDGFLVTARNYLTLAHAALGALPDGAANASEKTLGANLIKLLGSEFSDAAGTTVQVQLKAAVSNYVRNNKTGPNVLDVIKTGLLDTLDENGALAGVNPQIFIDGPQSMEEAAQMFGALGYLVFSQDDFWNGLIDFGLRVPLNAAAKMNQGFGKVLFSLKASYAVANTLLPFLDDTTSAPKAMRVIFRKGVPVQAFPPNPFNVEITDVGAGKVLYSGSLLADSLPTLNLRKDDQLRFRFQAYTSGVNGDPDYGTDLVHDRVATTFLIYKPSTMVHEFSIHAVYATDVAPAGALAWRSTLKVAKEDAIKPFLYTYDVWGTQGDDLFTFVDPGVSWGSLIPLPTFLGAGPGANHLDVNSKALVVGRPLRGLRVHFENYDYTGSTDVLFPVNMIGNVPPVPAFTGTLSGSVLTLDPSASTDADGKLQSYLWDFGDGTRFVTSAPELVHYRFKEPGTRSVTLTVMDDAGARASLTKPFVVPVPPIIVAFTATPGTLVAGKSARLDWTVKDAASLKVTNNLTSASVDVTGLSSLVVTPADTVTYTLTATNTSGVVTATTAITVLPPVVVVLGMNIQGLPSDQRAHVKVYRPDGTTLVVPFTTDLTFDALGQYTVTALPITRASGSSYTPVKGTFTFTIAASGTTPVAVTYLEALPFIRAIHPAQAPAGAPVLIQGHNLNNLTSVAFGTLDATILTRISDAEVLVKAPAAQVSAGVVSATNVSGRSLQTLAFTPKAGVAAENHFVRYAFVTQSTQDLYGSVPLIAGKPGLLRIFQGCNDLANLKRRAVHVDVVKGATVLASYDATDTYTPVAPTVTDTSFWLGQEKVEFDRSWNKLIPGALLQPGVSFIVKLAPDAAIPDGDASDDQAEWVFPVQVIPELPITFVPVTTATGSSPYDSPGTGKVTLANAASFLTFATNALPFSTFKVQVHAAVTATSWADMLSRMLALKNIEGNAGLYYGVTTWGGNQIVSGVGLLDSWVAAGSDWLDNAWGPSAASTNFAAEVLGHEVSHTFKLHHFPTTWGSAIDDVDPELEYEDPAMMDNWGYSMVSRRLVPNLPYLRTDDGYTSMAGVNDYMGYQAPFWVNGITFKKLAGLVSAKLAAPLALASPASYVARGRCLHVFGSLQGGEGKVRVAIADGTPTACAETDYAIILIDAAGRETLGAYVQPGKLERVAEQPFSAAIALAGFAPGPLKVSLRYRGTEIGQNDVLLEPGPSGRFQEKAIERNLDGAICRLGE
jgi:hypothetical protein